MKIRLVNTINRLVDTYFGQPSMSEKFINSTLKLIVKQNINKVDSVLNLFADENGEINATDVVNEYVKIIDENGFVFDLKKYIPNETVKSMIPDKILVIKREDVLNLLN